MQLFNLFKLCLYRKVPALFMCLKQANTHRRWCICFLGSHGLCADNPAAGYFCHFISRYNQESCLCLYCTSLRLYDVRLVSRPYQYCTLYTLLARIAGRGKKKNLQLFKSSWREGENRLHLVHLYLYFIGTGSGKHFSGQQICQFACQNAFFAAEKQASKEDGIVLYETKFLHAHLNKQKRICLVKVLRLRGSVTKECPHSACCIVCEE